MNSSDEHFSDGRLSGDRLTTEGLSVQASSVESSSVEPLPSAHSSVGPFPGDQLTANRIPPERRPVEQRTAWAAGAGVTGSLQSLLGTVVIAVFVITFIVQAFQIPSPSMENTLLVGDYLLVNKLCYGGGGIGDFLMPYRRVRRGDIVVFHYPVNPAQHFVKRVIGLPGDRVRLINKQVFVNGVPLKEPYVRYSRPADDIFRDNFPRMDVLPGPTPEWWVQLRKLVEDGQLIVPEGHYFVMGDNRDNSSDSRYWGFVPQGNIIGRPLLIYWSVQEGDGEVESPNSLAGRVAHFAYAVTHVFQITRWNRTLRLVK
jgi:signal peptidase I